jgi:hypothetical protein
MKILLRFVAGRLCVAPLLGGSAASAASVSAVDSLCVPVLVTRFARPKNASVALMP